MGYVVVISIDDYHVSDYHLFMKHEIKRLNCPQCGIPFTAQWPRNNKFCSRKCVVADYRKRHREEINAYSRNRPKKLRQAALKKYVNSDKGKETIKRNYLKRLPKLKQESAQKYKDDEHYKALILTRQKSNRVLRKSDRPYSCARCSAQKRLHCHHVDENPFNRDLSNLMWLCHWCHMRIHVEGRQSQTE